LFFDDDEIITLLRRDDDDDDPTTTRTIVQAVRVHGSRKAQTILEEVTTLEEMTLLIESSLPVVVLVAGDADNVKACAGYILEAWQLALERVGYHHEITTTTTPCQWLVSNHSIAVSVTAIDTEIAQSKLPSGCRG
jgi:hypothetical protein